MNTDLLKGRRLTGPRTNLPAAAAANAVVVFTQATFAQVLGTKTLKLKKITWRNNNCGDTWLHIGTGVGVGFVDLVTPIRVINNFDGALEEDQIPDVEANANITAYPDAVGGGSHDVQVEVEERG